MGKFLVIIVNKHKKGKKVVIDDDNQINVHSLIVVYLLSNNKSNID